MFMFARQKALKTTGLVLALLILTLFFSGSGCSLNRSAGLAAPVEEIDLRIVSANNEFAFNLYQELAAADHEKNILISPASIMTALAMTYNGAAQETERAMAEAMNLEGIPLDDLNRAFADLLTILQNPDPKVELLIANSLWAREGVNFEADFLARNEDHFKAEITALDFSNPEAAAIINDWVKKHTKDKIDQIVEPPINAETILFLINALYFNGAWSYPFDPELTSTMPFKTVEGSEKPVDMMYKRSDFHYLQNALFQAVSLPYGKNERIQIYLFLPDEAASLSEFYTALNSENWDRWTNSFGIMEGEVWLPRFSYEYEISLNDALKTLGMEVAFAGDRADFSGMHPIPPRLYISEVKHKTFIDVNEEGTEAAAVTSVEVGVTSMPEIFTLRLDRPFSYAITDTLTGTILFMGSVLEP